jgi:hypothetical protein
MNFIRYLSLAKVLYCHPVVNTLVCLRNNLQKRHNIELSSAAAYNPVPTVFQTFSTLPYVLQGDCSNDLLGARSIQTIPRV